jgi:hypothetical protein
MFRLTLLITLVAGASLLDAESQAPRGASSPTRTPTGVGAVVDRTSSKPIPDAIVSVTLSTPAGAGGFAPQRVMTDPVGRGRDITSSPLELKDSNVTGVVATFTNRPARIAGTVRNAQGAPDKDATVLLFPADASAWTDYGLWPRHFLTIGTTRTGTYALPRVPAGDYFLVAATESVDAASASNAIDLPGSLRDWHNPAFLAALSRTATRVRVTDGEAQTYDLKTVVVR